MKAKKVVSFHQKRIEMAEALRLKRVGRAKGCHLRKEAAMAEVSHHLMKVVTMEIIADYLRWKMEVALKTLDLH